MKSDIIYISIYYGIYILSWSISGFKFCIIYIYIYIYIKFKIFPDAGI